MVQRLTIHDNINDELADYTVPFTWRGRTYTIDLTEENAQAFDAAMQEWISYAEETGKSTLNWHRPVPALPAGKNGQKTRAPRPSAGSTNAPPAARPAKTTMPNSERDWKTPPDADAETAKLYAAMRKTVREWGRKNGWPDLGYQGNVPDAVYAAYRRKVGIGEENLFTGWYRLTYGDSEPHLAAV